MFRNIILRAEIHGNYRYKMYFCGLESSKGVNSYYEQNATGGNFVVKMPPYEKTYGNQARTVSSPVIRIISLIWYPNMGVMAIRGLDNRGCTVPAQPLPACMKGYKVYLPQ